MLISADKYQPTCMEMSISIYRQTDDEAFMCGILFKQIL